MTPWLLSISFFTYTASYNRCDLGFIFIFSPTRTRGSSSSGSCRLHLQPNRSCHLNSLLQSLTWHWKRKRHGVPYLRVDCALRKRRGSSKPDCRADRKLNISFPHTGLRPECRHDRAWRRIQQHGLPLANQRCDVTKGVRRYWEVRERRAVGGASCGRVLP